MVYWSNASTFYSIHNLIETTMKLITSTCMLRLLLSSLFILSCIISFCHRLYLYVASTTGHGMYV